MPHEARKQDVLIGLAFALGLALLLIPDTFFYSNSITTLQFWLNIASSCSDALIFTIVFVFLRREIHKRRDANKRLATANRLKSEFLQLAAHDLRNPLNAILLAASEIPPEKNDDGDSGEQIRSTASEMLGIIDGLLDAAALNDGTLKLNRTPSDLTVCLEEVVERNRSLAKRKNQQLLFSACDPHLADVDVPRIKQALDNLVSNAIKFSPLGATIAITIHSEGPNARIEVTDQGPGLTEADKKGLFGRFQRLSARPTGGETSTGLGLANARRLVELHGGEIGAESEGPGQGSRFWIELPAQTPTSGETSSAGI